MTATRTPEDLLRTLADRVDRHTGLEEALGVVVDRMNDDATPKQPSRRGRAALGTAIAFGVVVAVGGAAAAAGVTPATIIHGWALRSGGSLEPLPPAQATGETSAEALGRLATAARDAPGLGEDLGWVQVEWESWSLEQGGGDELGVPDGTSSKMIPITGRSWTALDGTYQTIRTGQEGLEKCGIYEPGPYDAEHSRPPHAPDVAAVHADFLVPHEGERGAWAIADSYVNWRFSKGDADPATRAAVLEALAKDGAEYLGRTTDRRGEAVDVISTTWMNGWIGDEIQLLIRPDDGSLVGYENVMHGPVFFGSSRTIDYSVAWEDSVFLSEPPDVGECRNYGPPG